MLLVNCILFVAFKEVGAPTTIENGRRKLHFSNTGLLERVEMKKSNRTVPVKLSYGLYRPVNKESGAYLLKPMLETEWKVFENKYCQIL